MKMDESLAAFQALILQMYRKVKTMHELALDILRSGDKEKALQLIYMDDFVNHLEEKSTIRRRRCWRCFPRWPRICAK